MGPLLTRLKQINMDEVIFHRNELAVQKQLAPVLRKRAIDHLANAKGLVAKSFRGEYLLSGLGDYRRFLQIQSQPGTWATYIEAAALGEMIGCHVVVIPVKKGIEQDPICLYRAAHDNAPRIHLYNANNTHWYVNSSTPTQGDGNCLYNAFAQALKAQVSSELRFTEHSSTSLADKTQSHGFLAKPKTISDRAVILFQKKIEETIQRHATPSQLEASLRAEKERISHLSAEEQSQITEDYKLALALSREEMGYAHKNILDCLPRGDVHLENKPTTL